MNTQKYRYKAFGLNISSDFQMDGLLPGEAAVDVEIINGKVPDKVMDAQGNSGNPFSSKNEFIFTVKDMAGCYVSNGNKIILELSEGVEANYAKLIILGGAMSVILLQRDCLPIHGSGVVIDGKGIIFSGGSGAGKSTLSMALRELGYSFLTDDVVSLSFERDGTILAHPSFPELKICKDSAEKKGIRVEQLTRVTDEVDKYFMPVKDFYSKSVPLAALFELDIGDTEEVNLTEIHSVQKLSVFLKQTYCLDFLPYLKLKQEHFGRCYEAAKTVPVFRITRPKTGFTTEKQIELILNTISRLEPINT